MSTSNSMNSIVDKLLENRSLENKKRFYNLIQFYLIMMKSTRKGLSTLESNGALSGFPSSITNIFGSVHALVLLMEIELADFDKFMKEEMNVTGAEIDGFKDSMNSLLETQITVPSSTIPNTIPIIPPSQWSSLVNPPTYQFQCNHMHEKFPTNSPSQHFLPQMSNMTPTVLPPSFGLHGMMQMPKMPYDDQYDDHGSPPTSPKIPKYPYYKMPASPPYPSEEMEECLKSSLPPSPIPKHKLATKLPKDWKKATPSYNMPKKKHTLKKHVKLPKFIDDSEETLSEDNSAKQTSGDGLHVEI